MYTQFFGNYLLSNAYVSQDELFEAMRKQADAHIKLGTLAINYGYMTAEEVDQVVIMQTHESKKFGELAVENGYLTEDQVNTLLKEQSPDFLLLGQILVDDGVISNSDLENIIADYRAQNEMIDLDMTADNSDTIKHLLEGLFQGTQHLNNSNRLYFELLFNNFIRFVGEDFTPLPAEVVTAYPKDCCVKQSVLGSFPINSYIDMDEETAIAFASRYVGDSFTEYDEYVQASLEDFLNLHNGLYVVNISNSDSIELEISAPESIEDPILDFEGFTLHFPVLYSFGTVHFMIELLHGPKMN